MRKTFQFKRYHSKRNKHLHRQIDIASEIDNHCIALHKRYYRLFGKFLNKYQLQKHLTELKKQNRYKHCNRVGSEAIQDITDRIDRVFFDALKSNRKVAPLSFKKRIKYKSILTPGDDTEEIAAPLFFRQSVKAIKKANKALSSKKKGSNNRKKARSNLARLHKQIANQRRDDHFKTANRLAEQYDHLFFEDLHIKAMQMMWKRKISDLGFHHFLRIREHCCIKSGLQIGYIDRFFPCLIPESQKF